MLTGEGGSLAGQGRSAFGGYRQSQTASLIQDLRAARVLNFEMEAATLLTLARLFGFRAGAICAVLANRITGEWNENGGVERACRAAAEAVRVLAEWDRKKEEQGKRYFCLSLMDDERAK